MPFSAPVRFVFAAMGFAFPDNEFGVTVAFVRERTLNRRKGFPHFADFLFQVPVIGKKLLILTGAFKAFGFDFTH
jgi:hypothetical protein